MGSTDRLAFPDIGDCEWMLRDSRHPLRNRTSDTLSGPWCEKSNKKKPQKDPAITKYLSHIKESQFSLTPIKHKSRNRSHVAKKGQSLSKIVKDDILKKARAARNKRLCPVNSTQTSVPMSVSNPKPKDSPVRPKKSYVPNSTVFCKNIPKFFRTDETNGLRNVAWCGNDNQVVVRPKDNHNCKKELNEVRQSTSELHLLRVENKLDKNRDIALSRDQLKTTFRKIPGPHSGIAEIPIQSARCQKTYLPGDEETLTLRTVHDKSHELLMSEIETIQPMPSPCQINKVGEWLNCGLAHGGSGNNEMADAHIYKQSCVNKEAEIAFQVEGPIDSDEKRIQRQPPECGSPEEIRFGGKQYQTEQSRTITTRPLQGNRVRPSVPLKCLKEMTNELGQKLVSPLDYNSFKNNSVLEKNTKLTTFDRSQTNTIISKTGHQDQSQTLDQNSQINEAFEKLNVTGKSLLPPLLHLPLFHETNELQKEKYLSGRCSHQYNTDPNNPPYTNNDDSNDVVPELWNEQDYHEYDIVPTCSIQSFGSLLEQCKGAASLASTDIDLSDLTLTSEQTEISSASDDFGDEAEYCGVETIDSCDRNSSLSIAVSGETVATIGSNCATVDVESTFTNGRSSFSEARTPATEKSKSSTQILHTSEHPAIQTAKSDISLHQISGDQTLMPQETQLTCTENNSKIKNNSPMMSEVSYYLQEQCHPTTPNTPTKPLITHSNAFELCDGVVMYTDVAYSKEHVRDEAIHGTSDSFQNTVLNEQTDPEFELPNDMISLRLPPIIDDKKIVTNPESSGMIRNVFGHEQTAFNSELAKQTILLPLPQKTVVKPQYFEMTETPQESLPRPGLQTYNPPRGPQRRRQLRSICTAARNRFKNVTSLAVHDHGDQLVLGDRDTTKSHAHYVKDCLLDIADVGNGKNDHNFGNHLRTTTADDDLFLSNNNTVSVYRTSAGQCPGNEVFLVQKQPSYQTGIDYKTVTSTNKMEESLLSHEQPVQKSPSYHTLTDYKTVRTSSNSEEIFVSNPKQNLENNKIPVSEPVQEIGNNTGNDQTDNNRVLTYDYKHNNTFCEGNKDIPNIDYAEEQEFQEMYPPPAFISMDELIEDSNDEYSQNCTRSNTPYGIQNFIREKNASDTICFHVKQLHPVTEITNDKTLTMKKEKEPVRVEGFRKATSRLPKIHNGSGYTQGLLHPAWSTRHADIRHAHAHTMAMARKANISIPMFAYSLDEEEKLQI